MEQIGAIVSAAETVHKVVSKYGAQQNDGLFENVPYSSTYRAKPVPQQLHVSSLDAYWTGSSTWWKVRLPKQMEGFNTCTLISCFINSSYIVANSTPFIGLSVAELNSQPVMSSAAANRLIEIQPTWMIPTSNEMHTGSLYMTPFFVNREYADTPWTVNVRGRVLDSFEIRLSDDLFAPLPLGAGTGVFYCQMLLHFE